MTMMKDMTATTTTTTTTMTMRHRRRRQPRAVVSITAAISLLLLTHTSMIVIVGATTTPSMGLRGQNHQQQQQQQLERRQMMMMMPPEKTRQRQLEIQQRQLLTPIAAAAADQLDDDDDTIEDQSVAKVTAFIKAENAKRKNDNKNKKKKGKKKAKTKKPTRQPTPQITNNNLPTVTVTDPTKITSIATTTSTKAATTTTTTTTKNPNAGKCALSSDGTTPIVDTIYPACASQHFCKLDVGICPTTNNNNNKNDGTSTNIMYFGTCQPQPNECSRTINPVCGCNGISYNNECIAQSEGISLATVGYCPTTTTGKDDIIPNLGVLPTKCILDHTTFTSTDCTAEDQFCQLDMGSCISTPTTTVVTTGTCQVKPKICALLYDPVCGCDGKTYGNTCEAHGAGMSVSYEGECIPTTNPPMVTVSAPLVTRCTIDLSNGNSTCTSSEQFCQLDHGACSEPSTATDIQSGTCQAKPSVCMAEYNPVCGCDGRTYDSICSAHGAGVSVSKLKPCDGLGTLETTTTTTTTTPVTIDKQDKDDMLFPMFEGPCTSDTQCAEGLVCHASSSKCVCNESTNEGCPIAGQLCGINPGLYCEEESCLPTCSCDYTSPFPAIFTDNVNDGDATSNGCMVGDVCRMPCAMADGGPTCFVSEVERDCREGYVCIDGNGDGVINQNDGGKGCVEAEKETTTTTDTPGTIETIGTPPIQELPCRIAGHCRSPSGVCEPPVQCIADPCSTATCEANYICEANYCGGCHASCVLADS